MQLANLERRQSMQMSDCQLCARNGRLLNYLEAPGIPPLPSRNFSTTSLSPINAATSSGIAGWVDFPKWGPTHTMKLKSADERAFEYRKKVTASTKREEMLYGLLYGILFHWFYRKIRSFLRIFSTIGLFSLHSILKAFQADKLERTVEMGSSGIATNYSTLFHANPINRPPTGLGPSAL